LEGETLSGGKMFNDLDRDSSGHTRRWFDMRVGITVYGLASVAAGIMDFIWGDFDSSHQPIQAFGDHIPGREILAYITAVVMIAGGVAILWRRSARAGAAALAVIYFIFALFWLPRLYTAPHFLGFRIPVYIGVLAGVGMELIAFAAGALIYASLTTQGSSWPRTILITRWIFGLCSIDFGLNHLMDVKDNFVYVPTWMPLGAEFWIIVTGICFVLAGLAILSGIRSILAARLLALMFLIFNLVALPPFIFADLKNHAAWGGNAFNLALVAANWILADSIATRQRPVQNQQSARPSLA
jgi:uncharacterized membrane protein YphA (DoxX/SURF4 family)